MESDVDGEKLSKVIFSPNDALLREETAVQERTLRTHHPSKPHRPAEPNWIQSSIFCASNRPHCGKCGREASQFVEHWPLAVSPREPYRVRFCLALHYCFG